MFNDICQRIKLPIYHIFFKKERDVNRSKIYQLFFISFIIATLATFHLSIFKAGFIVTISIVFLPFFIYINENLGALSICGLTALISPLIRYTLLLLEHDSRVALDMTLPDISFYITYGIIFHLVYERGRERSLMSFIMTTILCDYGSNIIEMLFRGGFSGISLPILKGLLLVAFLRSGMLLLLLVSLKHYKSFLVNQEHEARYRHLLHLTSTFKSEVYFMQKNMLHIEEVMGKSFTAYRMTQEQIDLPELQETLLDLTKEVHEIKKSYVRVIQGIKNIFPEFMELSDIDLRDITRLLTLNTREQLKEKKRVTFKSFLSGNAPVKCHYYLMSILANLVQNAIEASEEAVDPLVTLNISAQEGPVSIEVRDKGSGILPEHLDHIFDPGFSTKFDPNTGEINRGIGLTLVRDLIEEKFKGSISVDSHPHVGTVFSIKLPREVLEGGVR